MNAKPMHHRRRQWLAVGLALTALAGVLLFNASQSSNHNKRPLPTGKPPVNAANVAVINAESGRYRAHLTVFGNAQARYNMTLQAQVAGEITTLSPSLETGQRVQQGDTLLQLDDRDYLSALSSARANLASAKVALLEEEREGAQAQAEWDAAGLDGDPDSELVFRKPQLAAAEASLANARSEVARAQRDLDNTRVQAPFNALVVARLVAPGSLVQTGTDLATLYSSDEIEITLELSSADWNNLPASLDPNQPWPVQLTAVNGSGQWQGQVTRLALNLDETTRQRALVVTVQSPLDQQPALLPGTFVEAELTGVERDGLWQLPPSALSQRSEIWYVSADNTLASFPAQVAFADPNAIYVAPPAALAGSTQQVLVRPLNSYLQGMLVNPQLKSEGEANE
jgi:RND family efflux transporter MFP subunit